MLHADILRAEQSIQENDYEEYLSILTNSENPEAFLNWSIVKLIHYKNIPFLHYLFDNNHVKTNHLHQITLAADYDCDEIVGRFAELYNSSGLVEDLEKICRNPQTRKAYKILEKIGKDNLVPRLFLETSLCKAISEGDVDLFRSTACKLSKLKGKPFDFHSEEFGWSPIALCVFDNRDEMIRILYEQGADLSFGHDNDDLFSLSPEEALLFSYPQSSEGIKTSASKKSSSDLEKIQEHYKKDKALRD